MQNGVKVKSKRRRNKTVEVMSAFTLRLPEEDRARLFDLAVRDGVSMADALRMLIRRAHASENLVDIQRV